MRTSTTPRPRCPDIYKGLGCRVLGVLGSRACGLVQPLSHCHGLVVQIRITGLAIVQLLIVAFGML